MAQCRHLLFVYNADSGWFNALADIGHKLVAPRTYRCRLCSLTHGYLRERAAWREFLAGLPATCEFLHRDQFQRRFATMTEPLPAIFCLDTGQPVVCLSAIDLAHYRTLEALQHQLWQHCLTAGG